jgi:hypothetical protein
MWTMSSSSSTMTRLVCSRIAVASLAMKYSLRKVGGTEAELPSLNGFSKPSGLSTGDIMGDLGLRGLLSSSPFAASG